MTTSHAQLSHSLAVTLRNFLLRGSQPIRSSSFKLAFNSQNIHPSHHQLLSISQDGILAAFAATGAGEPHEISHTVSKRTLGDCHGVRNHRILAVLDVEGLLEASWLQDLRTAARAGEFARPPSANRRLRGVRRSSLGFGREVRRHDPAAKARSSELLGNAISVHAFA